MTLASGIDGTWTNSSEYDPGELRRADAAIFSSAGIARGLEVTVTASDVVRVSPGSWVIDGDATAQGAGVYRGGISSQVSDNLTGRDATYGRVDLVVARQYDADVVGAHSTRTASVEVLTGSPSSNPSPPALPDLAIELARLEVPADSGGAVAVDTSAVTYAGAVARDTGWRNTDPASGWEHEPNSPMQVRIIGGVVYLRGRIQRSGTSRVIGSSAILVADIPEGFWPADQSWTAPITTTSGFVEAWVNYNGQLMCRSYEGEVIVAGDGILTPGALSGWPLD